MTSSTRLGGFKVLDGLTGFSLILPKGSKDLPTRFCMAAARKEINFPYFTLISNNNTWGINALVESAHNLRLSLIIHDEFGNVFQQFPNIAILSIFPHKKDPDILGRLIKVLGDRGLDPHSLANSPSAISIVIKADSITKAGRALFEPFSFGSYRTPADWKLAQKGKESLHKEVVATYQELKPKIYGLEYIENQELLKVRLNSGGLRRLGVAFKEFAQLDLSLTFSTTGPYQKDESQLLICLPESKDGSYLEIINRVYSGSDSKNISPVAVFSMNGPHFGDRYGIISELLAGFEKERINLLGLSCTIASITGVVDSLQIERTIRTIQDCFEVPSVFNKT